MWRLLLGIVGYVVSEKKKGNEKRMGYFSW